ncbi:MAG: archaeosortase H N-terminal-like domain-containing protein [Promethearchaeota archaeon]
MKISIKINIERITRKKLFIWILISINLLFSFIIGFTIPVLKTSNGYFFGIVMIPLLIILNYIIIDRFHYYINQSTLQEGKDYAQD